jgi:hypothetical protein
LVRRDGKGIGKEKGIKGNRKREGERAFTYFYKGDWTGTGGEVKDGGGGGGWEGKKGMGGEGEEKGKGRGREGEGKCMRILLITIFKMSF